MDDKAFAAVVKDYLLKKGYDRLNKGDVGQIERPLFFKDIISDDEVEDSRKYVDLLPVYSLQAVATSFREQTTPTIKGWKPIKGRKINKNMFIAQVIGKSMEPTIPDGS